MPTVLYNVPTTHIYPNLRSVENHGTTTFCQAKDFALWTQKYEKAGCHWASIQTYSVEFKQTRGFEIQAERLYKHQQLFCTILKIFSHCVVYYCIAQQKE